MPGASVAETVGFHSGVDKRFLQFSLQLLATVTSTKTGASQSSTSDMPSSIAPFSHALPASTSSASISTTTSSCTRFTSFGLSGQSLRRSQSRAVAYLKPSPALPCIGVFKRSWHRLLHQPKRYLISKRSKRPDSVRVRSSPALTLLRSARYQFF